MTSPDEEDRLSKLSDVDLRDLAMEWEVENVPPLWNGTYLADDPVQDAMMRYYLINQIRQKERDWLNQNIQIVDDEPDLQGWAEPGELPRREPGASFPPPRQEPHVHIMPPRKPRRGRGPNAKYQHGIDDG